MHTGYPVMVVVVIVVNATRAAATGVAEEIKIMELKPAFIIEDRINEIIELFPKYFF